MRIGIDARFYGPRGTGIGRTLVKLLENLEEIDQQNDYIIFLKKDNWELYQPRRANFRKVLADVSWYSLAEQILLPRLFGKEKLDLLHVPHFNIPVLYKGKIVVTIHDLIVSDHKTFEATTRNLLIYNVKHFGYQRVLGQAVNKASQIIVPSEAVKSALIQKSHGLSEKINVIYEASEEVFSQKDSKSRANFTKLTAQYPLEKPFLLYVGNSFPHKNLTLLLKALTHLETVQLVLVSSQNKFLERIKEQIQNLGLKERVVLIGYVDDATLKTLYQEAVCFVFPSLAEGFGLPGLEAMAAGTPVLASDIPVFKEVYGEAAIYFDPLDDRDLAARISLVSAQSAIREKYTSLGFSQVKKYSWAKYARATQAVYLKAIQDES